MTKQVADLNLIIQHTVLITIRSLLDDEPYRHEPGNNNNPVFNQVVEYTTWKCLLLDYLAKETNPAAKAWLDRYVQTNGQAMLHELSKQQQAANVNKQKSLKNPYSPQQTIHVDYPALINDVKAAVSAVREKLNSADNSSQPPPVLESKRTLKRKASHHQASTKGSVLEIEKEETERKRAKSSVAAKRPSTPEIIDLT